MQEQDQLPECPAVPLERGGRAQVITFIIIVIVVVIVVIIVIIVVIVIMVNVMILIRITIVRNFRRISS